MSRPPRWTGTGAIEKRFEAMHESFLKRGKEGKIGLLFLGDSITEGWGKAKKVWEKYYGKDDVANFGISGDQTQHVLWRIDNGELDGISPKVVVLMIGTNNIAQSEGKDSRRGDQSRRRNSCRNCRTASCFCWRSSRAAPIRRTKRSRRCARRSNSSTKDSPSWMTASKTRYLDIGPKFLDADGKLPKDIMPDALHPNEKGYQIWADAMQPLLDEMMK